MITMLAPAGTFTCRTSRLRQSISRACCATPIADAIWSITPHGIPMNWCSTSTPASALSCWDIVAPSSASPSSIITTSTAADDDSPAPIGMSPPITASKPGRKCPWFCSHHSDPRGYLLQAGRSGSSNSSIEKRDSLWKSTDTRFTVESSRGRAATYTARSMAAGSTNPSL